MEQVSMQTAGAVPVTGVGPQWTNYQFGPHHSIVQCANSVVGLAITGLSHTTEWVWMQQHCCTVLTLMLVIELVHLLILSNTTTIVIT